MNQFSSEILAARKQQLRRYFWSTVSVFVIIVVILAVIFISRATRIAINPDDAAANGRINIAQGLAVVINESVYALSGTPTIRVEASGFYPLQKNLTEADFGNVVGVTLEPLPATLKLTTSLEDNQTRWLIDDQRIAAGNSLVHELPAGDYQLLVQHPHYQPITLDLNLARGEIFEKSIALKPIDGTLSIDSNPTGAMVTIDGIEQGQTPLELPLKGGLHDVVVSKANHAPAEETIEIKQSASSIERTYRLGPESASIKLNLQPQGGKLTINGIQREISDTLTVEAGKSQRLIYSKAGFFSHTDEFNLQPNQQIELDIALEPEMGKVEILSSPSATVKLNGKTAGTTPLDLTLQAVTQDIRIELPGYRSISQTVIPSASSTKNLSFTLVPEAAAQLAEAPQRYRHKAGGELLLFKPNDTIVMGARRSEPGQRANEFIRQVRLSRPFYASVSEVTNAEYRQFTNGHSGDPQLPVTSVSWTEAAQFCNWLSREEGLEPVYGFAGSQLTSVKPVANGYRLLTEPEWEWLARKAGKSKQTRFVWGDDSTVPAKAANLADESAKSQVDVYIPNYNDGLAAIAPVKSLNQEASGLYDLGGNVSEWVHDSYSLTPPVTDHVVGHLVDDTLTSQRVVKGANWQSGTLTEIRAAYRRGSGNADATTGFRIGRFVIGGD